MPDQAPQIQGSMAGSSGALGQIAGTVLGLMTAGYQDNRQRAMNEHYLKTSEGYNKRMAEFNQKMGLEMWEKTGYGAQRKQMEAAGINPGLMYGGAGSGGTTQGGQAQAPSGTSNVGSGEVGMGLQMGMQGAMLQAQIENIKANTEKTKVDTAKTAGVDTTKVGNEIEKIAAETQNEKEKNVLLKLNQDNVTLDNQLKAGTLQSAIEQAGRNVDVATEQLDALAMQNEISRDTIEERKAQIRQATLMNALTMDVQKQGMIKTGVDIEQAKAAINKIGQEILTAVQQRRINRSELEIKQEFLKLAEKENAFNTGAGAEAKRWADTAGAFAREVMKIVTTKGR